MKTFSLDRARLVTAGGLLLAGAALSPTAPASPTSRRWPARPARPPTKPRRSRSAIPTSSSARSPTARRSSRRQRPNTGNWDMITVNETGPHKGRYLFTVFETGQSGVQRHDLLDRRDRHHLAEPGAAAATSRSMPATGRRGARSSPPRNPGRPPPRGSTSALRPPVRAEEPARRAGHHRPARRRRATPTPTSCTRT